MCARKVDIITNFAFDADVGDESLAGFGIDAGEVACIGVAVWIGIGGVEKIDEVVAVVHDGQVGWLR